MIKRVHFEFSANLKFASQADFDKAIGEWVAFVVKHFNETKNIRVKLLDENQTPPAQTAAN